MNTERMALARRVGVHKALSDPARLRIVDTLSFSDAAPAELRSMLAMSSNLLAHHLRILEGKGLLTRHRSEADRRRTYLRLVPDSLEGVLLPGLVGAVSRIVFVCTANSARSQLAAALWRRSSSVPVTSAGTHPAPAIDPRAVAVAHRRNVPLRVARPRPLGDVLDEHDFVITVCDNAHEQLTTTNHHTDTAAGLLGARCLHWSVPDPVRVGSDAAFDATFAELTRRVCDLAPRVTAS